jgi:uncharacterized protein DUF3465
MSDHLSRYMHFILGLLCAISVGCSSVQESPANQPLSDSDQEFARAFDQGRSSLQVEGQGVVRRLLSDDNEGSRHQRFIVALASGQTLLIAHNIDLAPRVVNLREGDTVTFSGQYEWDPKGGRIHWTHHDPNNRHAPGWIRHNGQVYQ